MSMNRMLCVFVFTMLMSANAWAIDLQTARSQGMVAEGSDGYIMGLATSGDVGNLVRDVNAKRQEEYARISSANGQPVDVVAKLAAPQIIAKLPAGAKYQDSSGSVKTK
jgi:uncharacterized protein YdbL (DUF1318 family)